MPGCSWQCVMARRFAAGSTTPHVALASSMNAGEQSSEQIVTEQYSLFILALGLMKTVQILHIRDKAAGNHDMTAL